MVLGVETTQTLTILVNERFLIFTSGPTVYSPIAEFAPIREVLIASGAKADARAKDISISIAIHPCG